MVSPKTAMILNLDAVVTQVAGFSKAPKPKRKRQTTKECSFLLI